MNKNIEEMPLTKIDIPTNIDKNDSILPKLSIAISLTKKTNRFFTIVRYL